MGGRTSQTESTMVIVFSDTVVETINSEIERNQEEPGEETDTRLLVLQGEEDCLWTAFAR